MAQVTQAVVLCGGLGTRLLPFTNKVPKPMIDCNGRPFLWHLLNQLNQQGISNFLLLTGYLPDVIKKYFKDGSEFGWNIEYSHGPIEWDSGRRVWEALPIMHSKILLLYSDNFAMFELKDINLIHNNSESVVTLTVVNKSPGNIKIDEQGRVDKYSSKRSVSSKFVEIGYMIVESKKILTFFDKPDCNFSSIISNVIKAKKCGAIVNNSYYHSISDPKRWEAMCLYLSPKKIILIDRDGVINEKVKKGNYVTNWKDFVWIKDSLLAMENLSKQKYSFIIITNQAGIARKKMTSADLTNIHTKMLNHLKSKGINVLDVYTCPHDWNENCDCRKPKPGMLIKASIDYSFRLDKSLFIGDDIRDAEAANNAGVDSVLINNDNLSKEILNNKINYYPALSDAIGFIKERVY